jgi:hypothetical protein
MLLLKFNQTFYFYKNSVGNPPPVPKTTIEVFSLGSYPKENTAFNNSTIVALWRDSPHHPPPPAPSADIVLFTQIQEIMMSDGLIYLEVLYYYTRWS